MSDTKSVELFPHFPRDQKNKKHFERMKYNNILLVDDDMDDRMLFQQTLEEMDPAIRVHDVENGLDMVDWLDRCSDKDLPDLVILDQIMPKMTGKETLIF